MRVGVYYNNKDVRVEERPKPIIGAGELLVEVKASGICGSDVMEWYRLKKAPLVLGHEIAGVIVEVGAGIKNYKIGDRVFVSHHVPCNACHYCLLGHYTACEILHTTNYYPGGFSEYIRVPAINVERGVFILPKGVSFAEGTFIEPLACVVRGQSAVNLRPAQSVLILGCGISGLLHLLLARHAGAKPVVVTEINEYRLKVAAGLGADQVIRSSEDIVAQLRKINAGRLADLVVICTSSLSAFNQALQTVDRGGTILCFAPLEPGVTWPVPVNDFWRNNIKIIHSYGASPQDISKTIELMQKVKLPLSKLITHAFSLRDIGKGFKLVAEAGECLKVIIEPHQ